MPTPPYLDNSYPMCKLITSPDTNRIGGLLMSKELQLGDVCPDFSLPGTDGKDYSLFDFKSTKALVVIFTCNHCPYVKAYDQRIIELQEEFKDKAVAFVGVNSNDDKNYPEDSFDNMVKKVTQIRMNYPYLRDETQAAAHAFGASHTPQIFVFDSEKKLRYTGKVDDNWREPNRVKQRFLRDALVELAEGKDVTESATHAIGCTIKWR